MAIFIDKISKSYGDKKVLSNFSLNIPDSSNISIMGESGCGKTTLLKLILGLEKIDSGEISDLDNKKISACFQEDRLVENLTAYRNIKIVSDNKITKDFLKTEFSKVGLEESVCDSKIEFLSGGMKRRIAIIRALIVDSDIVLLDEPTKGLDDVNKKMVLDYILEKTKDKTLICVTHSLDEAKYISDTIVNM